MKPIPSTTSPFAHYPNPAASIAVISSQTHQPHENCKSASTMDCKPPPGSPLGPSEAIRQKRWNWAARLFCLSQNPDDRNASIASGLTTGNLHPDIAQPSTPADTVSRAIATAAPSCSGNAGQPSISVSTLKSSVKQITPRLAAPELAINHAGVANTAVALVDNSLPRKRRVSFSDSHVVASGTSAPVSNQDVLWDRLARATSDFTVDHRHASKVGSNDSDTSCVAGSAKQVTINGKEYPVHANEIRIINASIHPSFPVQYITYVAGQSPESWSACEKMLILGMDSKQGLFQFTSSSNAWYLNEQGADVAKADRSLSPVIEQLLLKKTAADKQGVACVLGNRYQVDHIGCEAQGKDFNRYLIAVQSLEDNIKSTIPITIAALGSDRTVLQVPEIVRAKKLMEDHTIAVKKHCSKPNGAVSILSDKGTGQNAALIVYQELSRKIDRGNITPASNLDRELERVILHARQACGPEFIHSAKQLAALKASLERKIQQRTNEFKKTNSH